MREYTIKAGDKNYQPLESWWPILSPKGFDVEFEIRPGGWASLEDWGGDRDWFDKMKLKGLTSYFGPNNSRSAMIAFAYGEEPETWVISGYTNYPGSDIQRQGESVIIRSGTRCKAKARLYRNKVIYWIEYEGRTIEIHHSFVRRLRIAREVGTYPGGSNNADGPHGGRAFKDMSIGIAFKVIKQPY